MLDKTFDQLSMKEKLRLQSIMKKKRAGQQLQDEESALYERFSAEFVAAEGTARGRWPIILGLLLISSVAVLRSCMD